MRSALAYVAALGFALCTAPPTFAQLDEMKEQKLCKAALAEGSDLLGVVMFDLGKSGVTREGRMMVVAFVAELKRKDPSHQRQVLLVGHTDQSGADGPNLQLSLQRAKNISTEILKADKDRTSVDVVGCGQSAPLLPLEPQAEHPHNRRVELRLQTLAVP